MAGSRLRCSPLAPLRGASIRSRLRGALWSCTPPSPSRMIRGDSSDVWICVIALAIMRTQCAAREQSGAWRPTGTVAPATFNASTPPAPHPPPGDGPGPGEAATLAQRKMVVGWLVVL